MSGIHSCSYHCTRPGCIAAQRNELRERLFNQANLNDPAVQKRLAAQWGYAPAAPSVPAITEAMVEAAVQAQARDDLTRTDRSVERLLAMHRGEYERVARLLLRAALGDSPC